MLNTTIAVIRRVEAARNKRGTKGRRSMTPESYHKLETQLRDAYKDELHMAHEAIIEAAAVTIREAEAIEAAHREIDQALHTLQYEVMNDPPRYITSQGNVKLCPANDKRLPALHIGEDILDIVRAAVDEHMKNERRKAGFVQQSEHGSRKQAGKSRRTRKKVDTQ